MPLSDFVNLHENLPSSQQFLDPRPTPDDEVFQERVAAIATGEPHDSGRWPVALLQLNEVAVLGDHHSLSTASLLEDLDILRREETEIGYVECRALAQIP